VLTIPLIENPKLLLWLQSSCCWLTFITTSPTLGTVYMATRIAPFGMYLLMLSLSTWTYAPSNKVSRLDIASI